MYPRRNVWRLPMVPARIDVYKRQVQEVLIEEVNDHRPGYVTGRMSNNLLVHFPGEASQIGQYVNVSLDECKGFYFMGTIV